MTITLHGIPNCDTVKKARAWLEARAVPYHFHDFKKQGASTEMLARWTRTVGWQTLLNRQGTTWRRLDAAEQAKVVDAAGAFALMQSQPSAIKRPVLEDGDRVIVGFEPARYEALLSRP